MMMMTRREFPLSEDETLEGFHLADDFSYDFHIH